MCWQYVSHEDLLLAWYTVSVSLAFSFPFIFQTHGVLCSPSPLPLHPNHPQDSCPRLYVSWKFSSAVRITKQITKFAGFLVQKKLSFLTWYLSSASSHQYLPSFHYENTIPWKCFQLLWLFRNFIYWNKTKTTKPFNPFLTCPSQKMFIIPSSDF